MHACRHACRQTCTNGCPCTGMRQHSPARLTSPDATSPAALCTCLCPDTSWQPRCGGGGMRPHTSRQPCLSGCGMHLRAQYAASPSAPAAATRLSAVARAVAAAMVERPGRSCFARVTGVPPPPPPPLPPAMAVSLAPGGA
eukprot:363695-Chlamydomonas_euryale.AAC.6